MQNKRLDVKTLKYIVVKKDMILTATSCNSEICVFNTYDEANKDVPDGFIVREVILSGSIDV